MSLKTDIDQFVTDVALVHSWAHGSSSASVTMGGASVRSPAKLIADYSIWLTANMQALGTVNPANVLFTGGSISGVAGGFTTLTASGLATLNGGAVVGGNLGVGVVTASQPLHVEGAAVASGAGSSVAILTDNTPFASGVGGGIVFRGKYDTAGTITNFGYIKGVKNNATDGNYESALSLGARANGGALVEVLKLMSGNASVTGAFAATTSIVAGPSTSTGGYKLSANDGTTFVGMTASTGNGYMGCITNHPLIVMVNNTEVARHTSTGFSVTVAAGTQFTQSLLNLVSGGAGMVQAYNGAGGGWNAAAAALLVTKNTTTSRSINAAGTVNASGADYAEYERNNGLTITKGDVVGFKADGTLTNVFSEAIRFGIKSTDPSYVGGDVWGTEAQVGARPVEPAFAEPAYAGSAEPQLAPQPVTPEAVLPAMPVQQTDEAAGTFDMRMAAWQQQCAEILAAHDAAMAQYQTAMNTWQPLKDAYDLALAQHQADMAAHAAAVAAAQLEFDTVTYPAYQADLVAFEGRLEAARQLVDRIAYSGKVPVNVTGAIPGDYLVALAAADGGITATPVADPTFAQYKLAIGRVNRILPDGRAEVAVMVH